jgi:hypothetical protein
MTRALVLPRSPARSPRTNGVRIGTLGSRSDLGSKHKQTIVLESSIPFQLESQQFSFKLGSARGFPLIFGHSR